MRAIFVVLIGMMISPGAMALDAGDILDGIGEILDGARRGDRDHRRDRDFGRSGGVTCSAADQGWEEHLGGHGSCRECLSRHGRCVETCHERQFECAVVGERWGGRAREYVGYGYSQRDAYWDAMDRCERQNRRCHQARPCRAIDQVVSRRAC